MPNWLSWWGEQDEQETVNVAELLEQVERQRAIIEEQARQIEAWKVKQDQWAKVLEIHLRHNEAMRQWTANYPKLETLEIDNVI